MLELILMHTKIILEDNRGLMLEIIKETVIELKKIKTENNESEEKLNNSVKNLEFIIKEYRRLIDEFVEKSKNQ